MAVHKKCAEKVKADCIKSSADEIEPEEAPQTVAWMDIAKENIQTYYKKGSPYDFYEKKEKLGEGGGGAVYKVVCKVGLENFFFFFFFSSFFLYFLPTFFFYLFLSYS
jgi:hypothetical protein